MLQRYRLLIWLGLPLLISASSWAGDAHGFTDVEKDWWAVQPLRTPELPVASAWSSHPVDRFVFRGLQSAKLKPAQAADRVELIRRAAFTLHGLPPTPQQVDDFVHDTASNAWERVVDELLASPRYGERWAQHWLDVVRYAETDGYRADDLRPTAYKYRDYVVRAFNQDKPYDVFVREQLAGDELGGEEARIATAFLRHGIYEWNQRDARGQWDLILHEMTRVTGETFLGLGIGCAQCHDHKFDPLLQTDYYALQAFFSTVSWPDDEVHASPEQRAAHAEAMALYDCATSEIRAEMDGLVAKALAKKVTYTIEQFPEDLQAMYQRPAAERSPYQQQMASLIQRQVDRAIAQFNGKSSFKGQKDRAAELKRYLALEKDLKRFSDLKPQSLPRAFVASDVESRPVPVRLKQRGKELEVPPRFLALLGGSEPVIHATETTTGRRRALAEWVTETENPLTTRVIVNRIWQYHFGQGIVPTPNDFGTLGEAPSHPDLLDWLARRFVADDWSFKAMHRLLLTSATWQQTARREPPDRAATVDPGNRLLWRYPPRRLSAEEIRDSMLAISGELQHRSGGASVSGNTTARSVFVTKKRNRPDPVLQAFDAPSGFESAPTRIDTTTPTQALLMSNHAWPQARSRAFAKDLLGSERNVKAVHIDAAYRRAYGRAPSSNETVAALAFIESQTAAIEADPPPLADAKGYEPVADSFKSVRGFKLGPDALLIRRDSAFDQVRLDAPDWLDDSFTVEAVAQLDSVYNSGSVNTLVSRWNGVQSGTGGWTFGVTSAKSAYEPQNVIVQLVGEDRAGNTSYVVVDSNIKVPLKVPLSLSAVISTSAEGGTVTFFVKDLSAPEEPAQVAVVPHDIVGGIQRAEHRLCLSGRDQSGAIHSWDGPVARMVLRSGLRRAAQLEVFGGQAKPAPRFAWTFDADRVAPVPGGAWNPRGRAVATSSLAMAMSDFCHALLMSNEALYLH